jgi:fumarate reductase flavoprotein subunit
MIHLGWPVFTEGGYQVNSEGRRFSNENAGYSEQAQKVLSQPGHVAWAVWDARCDKVASQMHSHVEAKKAGAIKTFSEIDALADFIGCPPGALRATIEETAAIVRGERACPWGREFGKFPPLAPPYYVSKITGALFHTQGGLEVDETGRVLRPDGSKLPNLFAGGGAARGLSGPSDWGYMSGSGLMMAVNLGRLAGQAAAALVRPSAGG